MYTWYLIDRWSGTLQSAYLHHGDKGRVEIAQQFGRNLKRRTRLISEEELLMAPTLLNYFSHRNGSIRIAYLVLRYQIQVANRSRPPELQLKLPSLSLVARRIKERKKANPNRWEDLCYYRLPNSIMVDRGKE